MGMYSSADIAWGVLLGFDDEAEGQPWEEASDSFDETVLAPLFGVSPAPTWETGRPNDDWSDKIVPWRREYNEKVPVKLIMMGGSNYENYAYVLAVSRTHIYAPDFGEIDSASLLPPSIEEADALERVLTAIKFGGDWEHRLYMAGCYG
jgi:hypothetical protein